MFKVHHTSDWAPLPDNGWLSISCETSVITSRNWDKGCYVTKASDMIYCQNITQGHACREQPFSTVLFRGCDGDMVKTVANPSVWWPECLTHVFTTHVFTPGCLSQGGSLTGWIVGEWRPRRPGSGTPWWQCWGSGCVHRSWVRTRCPRSPPRCHSLLLRCRCSWDCPVCSMETQTHFQSIQTTCLSAFQYCLCKEA